MGRVKIFLLSLKYNFARKRGRTRKHNILSILWILKIVRSDSWNFGCFRAKYFVSHNRSTKWVLCFLWCFSRLQIWSVIDCNSDIRREASCTSNRFGADGNDVTCWPRWWSVTSKTSAKATWNVDGGNGMWLIVDWIVDWLPYIEW